MSFKHAKRSSNPFIVLQSKEIMSDGIKIEYLITDFRAWKKRLEQTAPNVQFSVPISEETGVLKGRSYSDRITYTHRAQFETYRLTVRETHRPKGISYYLIIDGSLHKNYFGGKNYQRFTHSMLIEEIAHLCQSLQLEPERCRVTNLEFGVNIPFPCSPATYIDSCVLLHKTTPFEPYKASNGQSLGRYAPHAQYSVKAYDKGLQNELPYHLFRFELRFTKMQALNRIGIKKLSDLSNPAIIPALRKLLNRAAAEILIHEMPPLPDGLKLTGMEQELIKTAHLRDYWAQLAKENPERYKYERGAHRALMSKLGGNTWKMAQAAILIEWDAIAEYSPNLPLAQTDAEKVKFPEFTVKVKGKNGESQIQVRKCQSCGNDISHQRGNSKFCSPKYAGEKEAHRCRNANSNPRNNLKRKLDVLQSRGLLFDVLPYLIQRTDTNRQNPTRTPQFSEPVRNSLKR